MSQEEHKQRSVCWWLNLNERESKQASGERKRDRENGIEWNDSELFLEAKKKNISVQSTYAYCLVDVARWLNLNEKERRAGGEQAEREREDE